MSPEQINSDKSQCDLNDNQRLACALPFPALAQRASAFPQAGADVDARVLKIGRSR